MRSKIIISAFVFLLIGAGSGKAQSDKPAGKPNESQAKPQANPTPAKAQAPPKANEQTTPPNIQLPQDKPLGAAGASRDKNKPSTEDADFMVIRDRWRIGIPDDPRFKKGDIKNSYRQNVLKGDYPVIGNDIFLNLSLASESDFTIRRLPVPQGVSTQQPGSLEFFGRGRQEFNQNFIFSLDLFKGDASFKPVDWRFKVTGIANLNLLRVKTASSTWTCAKENPGWTGSIPSKKFSLNIGWATQPKFFRSCAAKAVKKAARRNSIRLQFALAFSLSPATFADSFSAIPTWALGCSVISARTAGNTIWLISTCWKKKPTAD